MTHTPIAQKGGSVLSLEIPFSVLRSPFSVLRSPFSVLRYITSDIRITI